MNEWRPGPDWEIPAVSVSDTPDEWASKVQMILEPKRHLKIFKLSQVRRAAVRWLWMEKVPNGALTLLVGREGIGKSTVAYQLAADVTRGILAGHSFGTPRSVVVVATEDSWAHTIGPRLDAAGADPERIIGVRAITEDGMTEDLQLPVDIAHLAELVEEHDVGLVLLDPLTSRLAPGLDTHKDAEVRKALEPLVRFADRSKTAVIGLMHVNKGSTGDPSTAIMGSRAFPAVARSVLFVQLDEDNENEKAVILEVVKANLGPKGKDNLLFEIEEVQTGYDEEQELPIISSRIHWLGNTDRNVRDAMAASNDFMNDKGSVSEAAMWLTDYLTQQGGESSSQDVKKAGMADGHTADSLKRARAKMRLRSVARGFPRKTYWSLEVTTEDRKVHQMNYSDVDTDEYEE